MSVLEDVIKFIPEGCSYKKEERIEGNIDCSEAIFLFYEKRDVFQKLKQMFEEFTEENFQVLSERMRTSLKPNIDITSFYRNAYLQNKARKIKRAFFDKSKTTAMGTKLRFIARYKEEKSPKIIVHEVFHNFTEDSLQSFLKTFTPECFDEIRLFLQQDIDIAGTLKNSVNFSSFFLTIRFEIIYTMIHLF